MRRVVRGKRRFSKTVVTELDETSSREDFDRTLSMAAKRSRNFDGLVDDLTDNAVVILKKAGLPMTPVVWKLKGGGWAQTQPTDRADTVGWQSLTKHLEEKKYEIDSLEYLAAKMVVCGSLAKEFEGQHALLKAYELGMIAQLFRTYLIESVDGQKSKGKSKKDWAIGFASHLLDLHGDKSFEFIWKLIPTELDDEDPLDIYRIEENGKSVLIGLDEFSGRTERIAKETFRTSYYQKEKRRRQGKT